MLDLEKLASRAKKILVTISVLGLLVLAAGIALTILMTLQTARKPDNDWISGLVAANGALVLAAIGLLITFMPLGVLQLFNILYRRAHDDRYHRDQMISTLESQNRLLEQLRDVTSLSDAAKQVAYRAKDLDALRAAIREDLQRGDFEAAMMLVNEMERRFGYALEADQIREQINESSRAAIDQRVADTVEHVELILSRHDWGEATRESDRILRLFPTHAEARKLPDRISQARDGHKRELLKLWKEAVARDDIDRSVELLHELDQYLTRQEAELYKDAARDVFQKQLLLLKTQFEMQVHDKNWAEALRIGKQITDEFPNTRMAQEVREKMPILMDMASQPTAV